MIAKTGSCNHCGKCCLPPVMLENACIELGEDKCKFYVDQLIDQKYGHCLIHGRKEQIEKVKDRFGNPITEAQIRWFNENCIDYPKVEDIQGGHIPPECSFTFEVVADG